MTMRKIRKYQTENFVRHRIRSPRAFKKDSFRTIDPGRKGHTKLIIGKIARGKSKGDWRVQSVLVNKQDYAKGEIRVSKVRGRPKITKKR